MAWEYRRLSVYITIVDRWQEIGVIPLFQNVEYFLISVKTCL